MGSCSCVQNIVCWCRWLLVDGEPRGIFQTGSDEHPQRPRRRCHVVWRGSLIGCHERDAQGTRETFQQQERVIYIAIVARWNGLPAVVANTDWLERVDQERGPRTALYTSKICLAMQVSQKVDSLSIGRAKMTNIVLCVL